MIPVVERRSLTTSGVEESIAFGISARDSVHIMSILRDQLYSDKVMAVLREIGANALDANASMGRASVPIEVTMPTLFHPTLVIRDRGPGLSIDDVRRVFSQYGASTKRGSNDAIGMLGIGSKSPFAYSDSFAIRSWHGGTVSVYNAVLDEGGAGRIDLLDVSVASDPTETGLEISLGIRPSDIGDFEDRARRLFVHFDPRPKINMELPAAVDSIAISNGSIFNGNGFGHSGTWTAVMGCIPYDVDLGQLQGLQNAPLNSAAKRIGGIIRFPIGDLQVSASRESLKYGDGTKARLTEGINHAIVELIEILLAGIDDVSNLEKRRRVVALHGRGLPVPQRWKHLNGTSVEIRKTKGISFRVRTYPGSATFSETNNVVVGETVIPRFVVRDTNRSLVGYPLTTNDFLVESTDDSIDVRKDLDALIAYHLLDGIKVVTLSSTYKWTKPMRSNSPRRARDRDRAKAHALVLKSPPWSVSDPLSMRWDPVALVPSSDDVFVVMESYRASYDELEADIGVLCAFGLPVPRVVGYKNTVIHPVNAIDCVGIEYSKWRRSARNELLMTSPEVALAVESMSSPNDVFETSLIVLSSLLEAGHGLAHYCRNASAARVARRKISGNVYQGGLMALSSAKGKEHVRKWQDDRNAFIERYPLLRDIPINVNGRDTAGHWADYIRSIDSLSEEKDRNGK